MNDEDEQTGKGKDKKRYRYFDIIINEKKVRILGYRIKNYKTPDEKGKVIEIVSQHPLDKADKGNVLIKINTEKEQLKITGAWKYGFHSPGNYRDAYLIVELIPTHTDHLPLPPKPAV